MLTSGKFHFIQYVNIRLDIFLYRFIDCDVDSQKGTHDKPTEVGL